MWSSTDTTPHISPIYYRLGEKKNHYFLLVQLNNSADVFPIISTSAALFPFFLFLNEPSAFSLFLGLFHSSSKDTTTFWQQSWHLPRGAMKASPLMQFCYIFLNFVPCFSFKSTQLGRSNWKEIKPLKVLFLGRFQRFAHHSCSLNPSAPHSAQILHSGDF